MGKMYAFIENGRVREIIKSEGIFEDVPLEKRYSKEIVEKCVECSYKTKEGMDYNDETGEFTEHIESELVIEDCVEEENAGGEQKE